MKSMSELTALDLQDNIAALTIAILRADVEISDDAFEIMNEISFRKHEKGLKKQVYKMREAGMSYEEIMKLTGLSLGTVYKYVSKERVQIRG